MNRIVLSLFLLLSLSGCFSDEEERQLCFVGDSITYMWDLEYFFPTFVVRKHAVSGAGLKHVDSWKIEDCQGLTTVLLIGTNDIAHWNLTNTNIVDVRMRYIEQYLSTAKMLNAEPLIVVSILPRNKDGKENVQINENIKETNRELENALIREMPNSMFVDVFDKFIWKDLEIREDLFKDGLHPNLGGYEILAREIEKKL